MVVRFQFSDENGGLWTPCCFVFKTTDIAQGSGLSLCGSLWPECFRNNFVGLGYLFCACRGRHFVYCMNYVKQDIKQGFPEVI